MAFVFIEPRARLDILDQAEYYADRSGIELAFRFQACVENTCALLASQPMMGKSSSFRHQALSEVRELPVRAFERHLIFYRPDPTRITVLRVLHGARDIEALVEDEIF